MVTATGRQMEATGHKLRWWPQMIYHPQRRSLFSASSHSATGPKYFRIEEASITRRPVSFSMASGHGRLAPSVSASASLFPASRLPNIGSGVVGPFGRPPHTKHGENRIEVCSQQNSGHMAHCLKCDKTFQHRNRYRLGQSAELAPDSFFGASTNSLCIALVWFRPKILLPNAMSLQR